MCIIEPGFFKTAVTSLDPLERELHRLWNQLSPEVQASYGDKYLDKCKWTTDVCLLKEKSEYRLYYCVFPSVPPKMLTVLISVAHNKISYKLM